MTETEVFAFADVFRGLRRVFPLRGEEHEITAVLGSYFKALRRYPLALVAAGAENCLRRQKHFPKPAEWIDAIPRQTQAAVEIQELTERESLEYRRAETLGYEDEPCGCSACTAAGVNWKPVRFVPDCDQNDLDVKAKDYKAERIITRGHWAHGAELARWYAAKSAFYEHCANRGIHPSQVPLGKAPKVKRSFQERMDALLPSPPSAS